MKMYSSGKIKIKNETEIFVAFYFFNFASFFSKTLANKINLNFFFTFKTFTIQIKNKSFNLYFQTLVFLLLKKSHFVHKIHHFQFAL